MPPHRGHLTGVVPEGSGRASRHDVARVEAVATLVADRLHISGPERKWIVCRHVSEDVPVQREKTDVCRHMSEDVPVQREKTDVCRVWPEEVQRHAAVSLLREPEDQREARPQSAY